MLIVMSLGGSVLAGDLDPACFLKYAEVLRRISEKHDLLVVTGGGVYARRYIELARGVGADEVACDFIGIDITRLNAGMLITALGDDAYPDIPKDYREAKKAMECGKIVVMGGVVPGQTTDAVSAAVAEHIHADLLVIPTSVDGVYTADPHVDPNAKKYDTIPIGELIRMSFGTALKAGSKSPIDPVACKLIERSGIRTIVMDGRDTDALEKLIDAEAECRCVKCCGTIIVRRER